MRAMQDCMNKLGGCVMDEDNGDEYGCDATWTNTTARRRDNKIHERSK